VPERDDVGHIVWNTAGDDALEQNGGDLRVIGQIDVPNVLPREPAREHLVVLVVEAEPEVHPRSSFVVEARGAPARRTFRIREIGSSF
jgi:hypothetical protein